MEATFGSQMYAVHIHTVRVRLTPSERLVTPNIGETCPFLPRTTLPHMPHIQSLQRELIQSFRGCYLIINTFWTCSVRVLGKLMGNDMSTLGSRGNLVVGS